MNVGKVDVLAVMTNAASLIAYRAELLEARAAVVELIEAARDVVQIIPATCMNDEKWLDNLRAALARIGGDA